MTDLPGQGLRALVVDDDPSIRELLRVVLELDGWEVLEASDGQQALEVAAAERPHGVVLDLMMPVLDGFSALAELRRTEPGRQMAVIVLTARSGPSDIRRGTRLGADLYVTKPFDPSHVVEQLAFHALRRNPDARSGPAAAAAPPDQPRA